MWRAAACVTSRSRAYSIKRNAHPLSKREKKGRERISLARDEVWIAEPTACPSPRGLSSVCVYFLTHIGDRHDASCTPCLVVEKRVGLGFVLLSPPLCETTRRIHNHHFERLKTQNGGERGNRARVCARAVTLITTTSEQARLPAEFKHIIKRRKRN